jgi:hypothetical protein
VAQFETDLPAVLKGLRETIEAQHKGNPVFRAASQAFLVHAQEAINPGPTPADVRETLIQPILTEGSRSRSKPSSTTSKPCCTTRCTARNMRRT